MNRPIDFYQNNSDERVPRVISASDVKGGIWKETHMTYVNGVQKHFQGASFSMRISYQEHIKITMLYSLDIIKRIFIETTKLLPFPTPTKLIRGFNSIGMKVMGNFLVNRKYMNPVADELWSIISDFLTYLGIPRIDSELFANLLGNIIHYDNAYYIRLEDGFSETTKERLIANPRKEIRRLMAINTAREEGRVSDNFQKVARIVGWTITIPKFKKAFIKAIAKSKFHKLQYDEADRYYACLRTDGYKYFGMTIEERQKLFTEKGWSMPVDFKENSV